MFVNICWLVNTSEYIEECHLWIHPYFSSSAQHVLFILLGWFVRWEASGHTAAVLYNANYRICSKQHVAVLCKSNLAFSQSILLKSMRCIYTIVPTQLKLGRISILFYQRDQISIWLSIAVYTFPMCMFTLLTVDEILLLRYGSK